MNRRKTRLSERLVGAPVAPGSTITFQKDSANTATFYHLDVLDLEVPPPPLSQPASSLSNPFSLFSYSCEFVSLRGSNNFPIRGCASSVALSWI